MNRSIRIVSRLALASMVSASAFGLEYSLQPAVEARATHNDNIRLSPVDPISLQGREVRTSLESQVAAETWQTVFNVDLRFNNFNREEFDSDDQFVDFNFNKDGERQSFGFTSNVTRDSTRTSEEDTTGVVGVEAQRRERYAVSPYWSYQVTDINRLSINGSFSRQKYDTGDTRYADYDYSVLGASWFTVVNEKLTLQLNVAATEYETDPREASLYISGIQLFIPDSEYIVNSKGTQVRIGGDYSFSENLTLNMLVGTVKTNQEYEVKDNPPGICSPGIFIIAFNVPATQCQIEDFDDNSLTGELNLKGEGERSRWEIGYSIANEPTSRGYEVESEEVSANWRYDVTERSRLDFRLLYGQVKAVDEVTAAIDANGANRDFVNTSVEYMYKVTETWRVFSDFRYRWQDRESAVDSAESYAVILGVRYMPTKSIWSR